MANDFLFTSESVSEGHPDKVADQISDAILDAIFAQDPYSRVAAETLTNTGLVVLAGEITTGANVDYIQVARDTIKRIGYDNTEYGIDYKGCAVLVAFDQPSHDIAQGVDHASDDYLNIGAGDQGLTDGHALAAIDHQHLVERDLGAGLGIQLLDADDVVFGDFVLFSARADDCEHDLRPVPDNAKERAAQGRPQARRGLYSAPPQSQRLCRVCER